jgi:hypothetical protein
MKYKVVFVLCLLVLASLISFSNRCRPTCDGRTFVQNTASEEITQEEEPVGNSVLLRMTIAL